MLWRLERKDGHPVLQPVPEEARVFRDDHRSVILFPGAGVDNQSPPRELVGSLKYLEQTLAPTLTRTDLNTSVDTYLWTYDQAYESFGAHAAHYNGARQFPSAYGRQVGQFVIEPFLLKPGEHFGDLSPETLKQRLSQMTLLGHSFGSIMNQDIANYLLFQIQRHGWNETTITDVLKELVTVSVASIARQDFPQPNATQYFFTASNDTTAAGRIRHHLHGDEARIAAILPIAGYPPAIEGSNPHKLKIRQLESGAGYAMRVALPEDEVYWTEITPEGQKKARSLTRDSEKETQVKLTHDYRNYLNGHQMMGDHLMNIMNNAAVRDVGIGLGHHLFERRRIALVPDPHREASIGIPESEAAKAERARG